MIKKTIVAHMLIFPTFAVAAEQLTMSQWIDSYVKMCVGSGSQLTVSGDIDANAALSLKKLGPSGEVSGKLHIEKKDISLLEQGISNAMNGVAADQANKVRECIAPLRAVLLEVMQRQMIPNTTSPASKLYILNPDEDKIMRYMAKTKGMQKQVGQLIDFNKIEESTKINELRLKVSLRALQEKRLINYIQTPYSIAGDDEPLKTASFSAEGEEYVLKMNYAE